MGVGGAAGDDVDGLVKGGVGEVLARSEAEAAAAAAAAAAAPAAPAAGVAAPITVAGDIRGGGVREGRDC